MKARWHNRALVALAVAVLWMCIGWALTPQGSHTIHIVGSDFGFAHLKSDTFIVLAGQWLSVPWPLFLAPFLVSLGATVVALAITFRHFRYERRDDV
jgi:hypothetical protein